MAVTDAIDAAKNRVSAMLEPISGGVGADCTYDELFEGIKAEIDKTTSLEGGKIDWNKIVSNAEELLTDKTKDFRLAVYYGAAKGHTGGMTGVLDALVLLNELNTAFWDKMYPPIKRPRTRGNLTQWFGDQLTIVVQAFTPTAKDADLVGAARLATLPRGNLPLHGGQVLAAEEGKHALAQHLLARPAQQPAHGGVEVARAAVVVHEPEAFLGAAQQLLHELVLVLQGLVILAFAALASSGRMQSWWANRRGTRFKDTTDTIGVEPGVAPEL